MTEYLMLASASGGACAALLILASLRIPKARHALFRSVRAWTRSSSTRSFMVLAACAVAAASAMWRALPDDEFELGAVQFQHVNSFAAPAILAAAPGAQGVTSPATRSFDAEPALLERTATRKAFASLRAYARRIDEKRATIDSIGRDETEAIGTRGLPEVDTMIARLRQRLEYEVDDVKGWTMLGWSYANTGHEQEAVNAYERALKLDADNSEIRSVLGALKVKANSSNTIK